MADRSVESIFASLMARMEAGEPVDLEAFYREHPGSAPELRELEQQWRRLRDIAQRFGLSESLSRTLVWGSRGPAGGGNDKQVDLASGGTADFTEQLMGQLACRTPSSDRYRLEGEVGRGGMGAVMRVWDEDLRRYMAMKVLLDSEANPAKSSRSPVEKRHLARFLEEAQVTGQLDHPGIVPVHELGIDAEGDVFFTMKLVKGKTLKSVFDELFEGQSEWTQTGVLGMLVKVCEAMSYAHAKGVIHRDLKPTNVMVGKFGEVYVMDWGLAKILGREDDRDLRIRKETPSSVVYSNRTGSETDHSDSPLLTMDGDIIGTPAYMPPEQAEGRIEDMGPASDVYALGAMLYHLLAGHMPFVPKGVRVGTLAILMRVVDGPPRSLHELAPNAPAELVAICEKAMERNLDSRYGDMQALAADLAAFTEGRVVKVYETGAWAEMRKWVQRNRALAASLAVAVLLAIAGVGSVSYVQAEGKAETRAANDKAEDVLRMSDSLELEDLFESARTLFPPYPANIQLYRNWIDHADTLLLDLEKHKRTRDEQRSLALERSEQQRLAERKSHPDYPRYQKLLGKTEAIRRALAQRRDGVEVLLPPVDRDARVADAAALNAEALPFVDLQRDLFGQESLGLALALRAKELVGDDPLLRGKIYRTLALAYFSLGRDDDALDVAYSAVEESSGRQEAFLANFYSDLESKVERERSEQGLAKASAELDRLNTDLRELDQAIDVQRVWQFPEEAREARWWNAQISKLITNLEFLSADQKGLVTPNALSPVSGWSVRHRLAFAEKLEAEFDEGGTYATRWRSALTAIGAAYPGLQLQPQMGLVPIGPDPVSGLWEFWDVTTGEEPLRGDDGMLEPSDTTGVVFVLVPSGTFWMGAQRIDPKGQNYDSKSDSTEGPVHEVTISAFLLSKFELTSGQWTRIEEQQSEGEATQANEKLADIRLKVGPSHPVSNKSWQEFMTWLQRAGMTLPSEAQWEYACRAGTNTVWWTGSAPGSLLGMNAANLADQTAAKEGMPWLEPEEYDPRSDSFLIQAPVGSFAANPFGFHDMHGNLWEWCLDGYEAGFYGESPKEDPLAPLGGAARRASRGGSYADPPARMRSANRIHGLPSYRRVSLGARPARSITE